MTQTLFTPSGVRLRERRRRPGDLNWLLLPGGPGIGSESLIELADALSVPGAVWLVDLPGDGSNQPADGKAPAFDNWPHVLLEAAQALPNVVYAGHSTGGMYLLSVPELEAHVVGLALLDTAPDASWHPHFVAMTKRDPRPAVDEATAVYERTGRDDDIAAIAVASAEWNFSPRGLEAGQALLARMPYSGASIAWSDAHFDHVYKAAWFPTSLPVLRLAGEDDRIVWQGGWRDARFRGPNVIERIIPDAGHFPWIENSAAVAAAFDELAAQVGG